MKQGLFVTKKPKRKSSDLKHKTNCFKITLLLITTLKAIVPSARLILWTPYFCPKNLYLTFLKLFSVLLLIIYQLSINVILSFPSLII